MGKKRWIALIAILLVLVGGVALHSWHTANIQTDTQQTLIVAPPQMFSESMSALHAKVRDGSTGKPIPSARVKLSLSSREQGSMFLAEGRTDQYGDVNVGFKVSNLPEGTYQLKVEASSKVGKDVANVPLQIRNEHKILLSTDKPVYQPGQTIHIRTLTLHKFHLKPLQQSDVTIEVTDPQGNKVFKKAEKTSVYGIAAADFDLASELNQGIYRVKATCNKISEEKEVTVKTYVLPKFKVVATFDQGYYLVGQTVKGSVDAQYFFGKPVAKGKLEIAVSTFDVEFHKVLTVQGNTDENGHYSLEFPLPAHLYGSALQKGDAIVKLDIKLTDTAEHSEAIVKNLTVSGTPMHIVAIPASPNVVADVPNTVYICTVYPDGTPAVSDLTVDEKKLKTSELGIAEFQVTPQTNSYSFNVTAKDARGQTASQRVAISASANARFLAVLDKVSYRAGEEVKLKVLSAGIRGNYYVDLIKEQQTVLTSTLEMKDGKAETSFTLPAELCGTLLVDVYHMDDYSTIARDTKPIFVAPMSDLQIEAQLAKDTYRPGEDAQISFAVKDSQGNFKDAALSLSIVDEAVFFLQEMQPGLEKVYFMLQKELLTPRYQIKYSPPIESSEVVQLSQQKSVAGTPAGEAKEQAARVMFAMSSVKIAPQAVRDTYYPKQLRLDAAWRNYFKNLWTTVFSLPLLIGFLCCLGIAIAMLWKNKWHSDKYYAKEEVAVQKTRNNLMQFRFYYYMTLIFPAGMFLLMLMLAWVVEYVHRSNDMLVLLWGSLLVLALSTLLFALTKSDRVRIARVWLFIGALLAVAAWAYTILQVNSSYWHYRDRVFETLLLALAVGTGKNMILFLGHGCRYFFHRERLPGSGAGVALTMTFITMVVLGFASLVLVNNDYDWRRATRYEWLQSASVLGVFLALLMFPMFGRYLRSYVEKLTWKWAIIRGSVYSLLVLVPFAIYIPQNLDFRSSGGWRNDVLEDTVVQGGAVEKDFRSVSKFAQSESSRADFSSKKVREETKEGLSARQDPSAQAPPEPQTAQAPVLRIREYFPETLYWNPQIIAKDGKAQLTLPLADSITTFRMSCQGIAQDGALGSMSKGLRIFQDFFVDIDFPVSLTQNDEVSIPVQIYNYLPQSQQVRLVVEQENWLELLSPAEKKITLAANEVTVAYFRIRATRVGERRLTVMAYGEKMSDAIKRVVNIVPYGEKQEQVINASLDRTVEHAITIPEEAIAEASKIIVKCYPGLTSLMIEGIEGMLRMPHG
jgi:hypothetical protein